MEFIFDEAEDDTPMLQFSDEDEQEGDEQFSTFIDDKYIPQEGVSFHRERSSQNLSDYPKFHNQTRDPIERIFSNTESYFGEDAEPERFVPENRETVDFDKFNDFEKYAEKFKKILLKFEDVDKHLFFSVIYDLMLYMRENDGQQTKLDKRDTQKVLGDELHFDLQEIESETLLDKTLFGFLKGLTK